MKKRRRLMEVCRLFSDIRKGEIKEPFDLNILTEEIKVLFDLSILTEKEFQKP